MNMDKKKLQELKAKLDSIAKEHNQDLASADYLVLVANVIAFVSMAERAGFSCEILGGESGDGFFEFDIKTDHKN